MLLGSVGGGDEGSQLSPLQKKTEGADSRSAMPRKDQVGFWASELTLPWYEFTKASYEVDIARNLLFAGARFRRPLVLLAPLAHGDYNRAQVLTKRRQRILHLRRHYRVDLSFHDAVALQLP